MVSAGNPGPLSVTEIERSAVDTSMSMQGAIFASSAASRPLSTSSLSTTSTHSCVSCPMRLVSSLALQNSSSRLVVNVARLRGGPIMTRRPRAMRC